jgi:hypothetical protein
MSSLSYSGFKPAPIWTILVGFLESICTALASSAALKVSDEGAQSGRMTPRVLGGPTLFTQK